MHQILISLVMLANVFSYFFPSLKSAGWLVNEVESKEIKSGLSVAK